MTLGRIGKLDFPRLDAVNSVSFSLTFEESKCQGLTPSQTRP